MDAERDPCPVQAAIDSQRCALEDIVFDIFARDTSLPYDVSESRT
jgi:hypothetical protein